MDTEQQEAFTERVEREAREAVAAFQVWQEAEDLDGDEYAELTGKMDALAATLNMNVR